VIGYLKGQIVALHRSTSHRSSITLDVSQVGYDIMVSSRLLQQLPSDGETVQIFTHLQIREDQWNLFGFSSAAERDLFRQLISVSGIGPQLGLALMDTFSLSDLVQAIVSGNTKLLAKTPGVGAKTAERIALELKSKLTEWREQSGIITTPLPGPIAKVQEDVELTLLALGYSQREVMDALSAVGQNTALSKTENAEEWIREAIAWLSQNV
jgi:holliday junction DNA helicase RuvA